MKLVVGLGNPGKKYARNRHNVGLMVLDEIIKTYVVSPHINKKFEAILYFLDKNRLLVKPQAFINDSGRAVKKIINFYKIELKDFLVVHDDVDLKFGQIRLQFARGSAGHKGVESVIEELGSVEFNRVRIGIGRPPAAAGPIETDDWVLQNFSESPKAVQKLIEGAAQAGTNWLKE